MRLALLVFPFQRTSSAVPLFPTPTVTDCFTPRHTSVMVYTYPKFRDDLIISQVKQAEQVYFVIKDPITNKFFRFKQPEYFITRQLDGKTPLEEIQQRFFVEFKVRLPATKLDRFVLRLQGLGFTERGLTERELSQLQRKMSVDQGRFRRLLSVKLKTVDPDSFFDAILPRMTFLFTRHFVLLVSALTIAAIAVVVSDWRDYYTYALRIFRPGIIPTLVLVTFVVVSLHELAHGLTCKYFGGHVREMGVLVLYFTPGFYCGVSDAWLFNDKSKRMWVSFAGMFFQMFVGALTAIAWRVIGHGTLLSDVCYITTAVSALTILLNLNPLIKLDGYYLLSDYLDIPNLRRVSFAYLGSKIGAKHNSDLSGLTEVARKEKLIYLSYSILAGTYSVGLIVLFFWKVIGFVFSQFRTAAWVFWR